MYAESPAAGGQDRQSIGTDGAPSAECASNTGKRGTALPRGQFVFSSAVCAESPADTSGARQAGYRRAAGETNASAGAGGQTGRPAARTARLLPNARAAHCKQAYRRAAGTAENPAEAGGQSGAWTARLLPSARASPVSGVLHCRAVSFVFKRGRSAESPADTSGAQQAGLSNGSKHGGNPAEAGGQPDRRHRRRIFCRVCERHQQAWSCISERSVLFSSAGVQLNLSRTRAAHCKRVTGEQRARRTLLRRRAAKQADQRHGGASSAECASGTGGRGTASLRGQFCFQVRRSLNPPRTRAAHCKRACRMAAGTAENPAGTGGKTGRPAARTARLLPSARATPASGELHRCAVSFVFKRGRSAESPAGVDGASSTECAEQHRKAWNCIAARPVLFSSAAFG